MQQSDTAICPDCGGQLDFDMSDNANDPAWFYCKTDGCGFTCDVGIGEDGERVPVQPNVESEVSE